MCFCVLAGVWSVHGEHNTPPPPHPPHTKVSWGIDLASEHEEYLAGEHFKGPIIVYNYPKEIKAFYMRLNDDGKTVAAMDVLVPKIGELVGGSQREERLDVCVGVGGGGVDVWGGVGG